MNTQRAITQAVRVIRPQYVCRRCRFLHNTAKVQGMFDQDSFLGRMKNLISGSQEAEQRKLKQEAPVDILEEEERRSQEVQVEAKTVEIDGTEYEIAISSPVGYKAADSWDGLQRIGDEEWQKAQKDIGNEYISFSPAKHDLSPTQWQAFLRHTVIEALTFTRVRKDVCSSRSASSTPWDVTSRAEIISFDDGSLHVKFDRLEDEEKLLQSSIIAEGSQGQAGAEQLQVFLEASVDQEVSQDAWLQVPLTDPTLKFAIAKRITQLTGIRFSDAVLSSADTVQKLYSAALVKPKPKKLIDQLQKLEGVANITVHNKRWSAVDKDKEIGRWKLIEEELIRRDLPLHDRRPYDRKIPGQAFT